jgi:hypothetical protein
VTAFADSAFTLGSIETESFSFQDERISMVFLRSAQKFSFPAWCQIVGRSRKRQTLGSVQRSWTLRNVGVENAIGSAFTS